MKVILKMCGTEPVAIRVDTFADVSRFVTKWQDKRGLGSSELSADHGKVYELRGDGLTERYRLVARVTYNGKVLKARTGETLFDPFASE